MVLVSGLTDVIEVPAGGREPLLLEVPVPPELDGPFLVTSARGMLWISDKFPSGVIRAAVRETPLEFLFRDAVVRVSEMSQANGWGSYQPHSEDALDQARAYLEGFGFDEVDVLHNIENEPSPVPWVPIGWTIVIPKDRSYLGTAFDFGKKSALTRFFFSIRETCCQAATPP